MIMLSYTPGRKKNWFIMTNNTSALKWITTSAEQFHLSHLPHQLQIGTVELRYVLSPSDFESFHYSIAEGVASGCVPIIWPWDGAEEFYPDSWIGQNHQEIVEMVLDSQRRNQVSFKKINS